MLTAVILSEAKDLSWVATHYIEGRITMSDMFDILSSMKGSDYSLEEIEKAEKMMKKNGGSLSDNLVKLTGRSATPKPYFSPSSSAGIMDALQKQVQDVSRLTQSYQQNSKAAEQSMDAMNNALLQNQQALDRQLKEMNAKRVFICCTFGLFTNGLDAFDKAYEKCYFDKVITTNLNYRIPELLEKPYYAEANMSKFLASIIDFMNHDISLANVHEPTEKIKEYLTEYNNRIGEEFLQ